MCKSSRPVVIFDMDGTILDSMDAAYQTVHSLLVDLGIPWSNMPNFRWFMENFSLPLASFFARFGVNCSPNELENRFREMYKFSMGLILLNHDAIDTLDWFRSNGVWIALVSSANPVVLVRNLHRFGLCHYFPFISAGHSDKAPSIRRCLRHFNCLPSNACYVGDTPQDMRDAATAGVIPIGFSADFSFMVEPLKRAGAWVCIDSLKELPPFVNLVVGVEDGTVGPSLAMAI